MDERRGGVASFAYTRCWQQTVESQLMDFHFSEVTIRSLIPKWFQEHRNIRLGLCCGGHLDGLSYSLGFSGNDLCFSLHLTRVAMMELEHDHVMVLFATQVLAVILVSLLYRRLHHLLHVDAHAR